MITVKTTSVQVKNTFYNSPAINAYLENHKALSPFLSQLPSPQSVVDQISQKQFSEIARNILSDALLNQYKQSGIQLDAHSPVLKNIETLRQANAYTVTAGQQIHAYLGPGLVINKILSVISLAKACSERTEHPIIPIFWMATEDHDFDEINHLKLFGKEFKWENPDGLSGPVGRKKNTGLAEMGQEIKELFKNDPQTSEWIEVMIQAYEKSDHYAAASRKIIHQIFENTGLVVIDPDDVSLKTEFKDILLREIENPTAHLISAYDEVLKSLHVKPQIHPRETNLFIIDEGKRERLIKKENSFQLLPSEKYYTPSSLKQLLSDSPENFSPNVALRPIYQETILPNLAYVAGGSEIIYWFQIKNIFEAYHIPYPVIWLRSSAIYIPSAVVDFIQNTGLTMENMFSDPESIQLKLAEYTQQIKSGPITINKKISILLNQLEEDFRSCEWFDTKTLEQIRILKKDQHNLSKVLAEKFDEHVMNLPQIRKLFKIKTQFFTEKQERLETSVQFLKYALELIYKKDIIKFSTSSTITLVIS